MSLARNQQAGFLVNPTSAATPVTISKEGFYPVDTAGGVRVRNLASLPTIDDMSVITIADITGNAGTNNITINAFAGQTINGAASYVIKSDFQSVTLKAVSATEWIILNEGNPENTRFIGASARETSFNEVLKNATFLPVVFTGETFDSDAIHKTAAEDSGTATSGAATTLTDNTQTWTVDQYKDMMVRITSGTGAGQVRLITSNTADTLTVSTSWGTNPDATSDYEVTISSRLTVPTGQRGFWRIQTRLTYFANAVGARGVAVFKNNSFVVSYFFNNLGAIESTAVVQAFTLELEEDDYIEIYAYQASGGDLSLLAIGERVYCQLIKERGA